MERRRLQIRLATFLLVVAGTAALTALLRAGKYSWVQMQNAASHSESVRAYSQRIMEIDEAIEAAKQLAVRGSDRGARTRWASLAAWLPSQADWGRVRLRYHSRMRDRCVHAAFHLWEPAPPELPALDESEAFFLLPLPMKPYAGHHPRVETLEIGDDNVGSESAPRSSAQGKK